MPKRTTPGAGKWSARKRILLAAIALVLAVVLILALDCRMVLRYYEIDAPEISSPISIVLVTDLHSCYYGNGQETLIRAIDAEAPDLILMSGDLFDDEMADGNTEAFSTRSSIAGGQCHQAAHDQKPRNCFLHLRTPRLPCQSRFVSPISP